MQNSTPSCPVVHPPSYWFFSSLVRILLSSKNSYLTYSRSVNSSPFLPNSSLKGALKLPPAGSSWESRLGRHTDHQATVFPAVVRCISTSIILFASIHINIIQCDVLSFGSAFPPHSLFWQYINSQPTQCHLPLGFSWLCSP